MERPVDLKLARKYWGGLQIENSTDSLDWKTKMAAMEVISKIYFELLMNGRAN